MERSVLLIVAILFVVAFVGFLTISPEFSITGNVVREEPNQCDSCVGDWVCGAKAGVVSNYPSACAATCDNAKIVFEDVCERIPHASNY